VRLREDRDPSVLDGLFKSLEADAEAARAAGEDGDPEVEAPQEGGASAEGPLAAGGADSIV
jgi:hypothetical protein